ncbi:MAG: hypothetical protein RL141_683 [Candidatus Parcubacteria bacterium]|jgi:hypothetical protein
MASIKVDSNVPSAGEPEVVAAGNAGAGDVRVWEAVGEQVSIVASGEKTYGLGLKRQDFMNPRTGTPETFVFFEKKDGVTTLAVMYDGRIALVQQFKQGVKEVVMESPAGLALENQDPATLAAERLRKETGFEPRRVFPLNSKQIWIAPRKSPSGFDLFVAVGCTRVSEQDLTPREEDIKVLLVSPEEFWKMVNSGAIRSAETLLAASLAALYGFIPGPVRSPIPEL